jgi:hypothetical protein
MKKVLSLILSISILTSVSNAQTVLDVLKKALDNNAPNQQQKTLKTITIISTTKKLNGGARAMFGGGFGAASRVEIPVTLPPNTVDWYYSFSTTDAGSGGLASGLKLAIQIGNIVSNISTAGIAGVITNGLSQSAVQSLQVPNGSMPINAYLLDYQNVTPFLNKQQFARFENESSERATQSVVRINSIKQGRYYIGLQNISSTSAVNIHIEVVAIVAE